MVALVRGFSRKRRLPSISSKSSQLWSKEPWHRLPCSLLWKMSHGIASGNSGEYCVATWRQRRHTEAKLTRSSQGGAGRGRGAPAGGSPTTRASRAPPRRWRDRRGRSRWAARQTRAALRRVAIGGRRRRSRTCWRRRTGDARSGLRAPVGARTSAAQKPAGVGFFLLDQKAPMVR